MAFNADDYAKDVLRGKVPAGKSFLLAAQRHLDDRDRGRFQWSPKSGERVAKFFREELVVGNDHKPFEFLDWQAFATHSLFSWLVGRDDPQHRREGTRRYRRAFVLTGKGAGKSPWVAGLGLYVMFADAYRNASNAVVRETNPVLAALATNQAHSVDVTLRPMMALVQGRDLEQFLQFRETKGEIVWKQGGNIKGQVKAWGHSLTGATVHGIIPSMIIAEEVHAWKDTVMLDFLTPGFKGRHQPLLLHATNAGEGETGPAFAVMRRAEAALKGLEAKGADDHFTLMLSVDGGDYEEDISSKAWAPVESSWAKANPSLGVTLGKDYLVSAIADAKTPVERIRVRRLQFGVWSDAKDTFLPWEMVERCLAEKVEPHPEARLFVGVDLGAVRDFTAIAYLWEHESHGLLARIKCWTPKATLAERGQLWGAPLINWTLEGHLVGTPGATTDFGMVVRDLHENALNASKAYGATDVWMGRDMRNAAHAEYLAGRIGSDVDMETPLLVWPGLLELHAHPQGFARNAETGLQMHSSIQAMTQTLSDNKVAIERNPLLAWMHNYTFVKTGAMGTQVFVKEGRSRDSSYPDVNDGWIAMAMAFGVWDIHAKGVAEPGDVPLEYWIG